MESIQAKNGQQRISLCVSDTEMNIYLLQVVLPIKPSNSIENPIEFASSKSKSLVKLGFS